MKGEIVSPFPHKLALLGLGNSVPTPLDGITAQVVVFDSLAALKAAPLSCCAGKIVPIERPVSRLGRSGKEQREQRGCQPGPTADVAAIGPHDSAPQAAPAAGEVALGSYGRLAG